MSAGDDVFAAEDLSCTEAPPLAPGTYNIYIVIYYYAWLYIVIYTILHNYIHVCIPLLFQYVYIYIYTYSMYLGNEVPISGTRVKAHLFSTWAHGAFASDFGFGAELPSQRFQTLNTLKGFKVSGLII